MTLSFRLFSKRLFCHYPAHQNEDQKVEFLISFLFAVIAPLSVLTILKDKTKNPLSRKGGRQERSLAHAQGIAPSPLYCRKLGTRLRPFLSHQSQTLKLKEKKTYSHLRQVLSALFTVERNSSQMNNISRNSNL